MPLVLARGIVVAIAGSADVCVRVVAVVAVVAVGFSGVCALTVADVVVGFGVYTLPVEVRAGSEKRETGDPDDIIPCGLL